MRAITIPLFLLAIIASCTAPSTSPSALADAPSARRPVVVELFSSEGCSSCPPADAALRALDTGQPEPAADVIALELHVDYWNDLGWKDPFSSAAFSARQRAYASAFGQRGVYTPQMVVDGKVELNGSDVEAGRRAVATAAKSVKATIQLGRKDDRVSVAVGELPGAGEAASVWLAITESGLRTPVPRGENAGATLAHGPVVRRLERIAGIAAGVRGEAYRGDAAISLEPSWKRENVRAVVFVQGDRSLQIFGAAAIAMK